MGSDTVTSEQKNISQDTSGTSNQFQSGTSQLNPFGPTGGILSQLYGNLRGVNPELNPAQFGAINQMTGLGQAGNPFAGGIAGLASTLLGGGGPDRTGMASGAYDQYQRAMQPTASGQFLDPNSNPFFRETTDNIANQVRDRVNAQYAGAGRDPAGAGSYLGEVTQQTSDALAPLYGSIYNTERGRQLDAITGMYGAGGSTAGLLSGLDQTRLGNQTAGIGAAGAANDAQMWGPQAVLQSEAARLGIPMDQMARILGITMPGATAFGTQNMSGTSSGTTTGTMTGTETTEVPWWQPALGAAATAAGIGAKAYGASDRRIKEDIALVGELFDGTPVYRFRFIGSPAMQIGLMAQDIEQRMPEAVAEFGGVKHVDYKQATQASVGIK